MTDWLIMIQGWVGLLGDDRLEKKERIRELI
jgi:hypothetical protein